MEVKIAELKNRLSHYLRLVEQGETITVLLRDRPVAKLTPVRSRKPKEDPDAAWARERSEQMAEAERLGFRLIIPLKRPPKLKVLPPPIPAPDGRTDINSVVEMRRERDY